MASRLAVRWRCSLWVASAAFSEPVPLILLVLEAALHEERGGLRKMRCRLGWLRPPMGRSHEMMVHGSASVPTTHWALGIGDWVRGSSTSGTQHTARPVTESHRGFAGLKQKINKNKTGAIWAVPG
jgi:hypothetical protein